MRNRSATVVTLVPAFLIFLSCGPRATIAQDTGPPPGTRIANLKQQLESGLKARRPSEFAFIGRVVALVQQGRLPEKLVKGTFQWSRKRNTKFPFPYFERALRLQARKLGVEIVVQPSTND